MLSSIISPIEEFLVSLAHSIPLELFVFIGSFIEEIIAPIPSPLIMITAGSVAALQQKPIVYLLLLSFLGSIGKTIGAAILYFVSDKIEDVATSRLGKFVGITHEQLESIGRHFKGGWRDFLILFAIRSLPVIPSAPVSIVSGIIKINRHTFLTATFFGSIIRDGLFIYFGYSGLSSLNSVIHGVEQVESVVQIVLFLALGSIIALAYYHRYKKKKN